MANRDLIQYRQEYGREKLVVNEMLDDPIAQFKHWFKQAESAGVKEPNTMTLATVDINGQPTIRVVLLKEITNLGLIFYSNFKSRKGREIAKHPHSAINFYWQLVERQVRFDGTITKINESKADAYFRTRPRGSQLGAWVSAQSEAIPSREYLEEQLEIYKERFQDKEIPRPPHWGGYLLTPGKVEFWQGGENRLHDRIQYTAQGSSWTRCRLAP
ncbi:MAG: pyridoxine/pyridoxamine 5'-phosphate oxidase [Cyclobacteriaceae bacterium]|nr:MAG: pyridoxine/pyridoxamine 5'-phosphate oxidase [Cyclobacteriaceae bacterium]